MSREMASAKTSTTDGDDLTEVDNTLTTDDEWAASQDDYLVKVLEDCETGAQIKVDNKTAPVKPTIDDDGASSEAADTNRVRKSVQNEPHSSDQDLPPLEPLHAFRRGYLWVSDFSSQAWCEQKLHYSYTAPMIGTVLQEDTPAMTEGSSLHLARELAAHDKVDVKVTSNEDIWAIKVINLLTSIQGFLNGLTLAREVPVFGAPFDQDVFIVGMIDELRFDLDQYTVDLSDLKTRTSRHLPSKSQESQHSLQVMLYKKLFDDLVRGNVAKDLVAKHLRLKLDKEFGESIQAHLLNHGIECRTLSQLLDFTFHRLQSCTCVNALSIEYVFQDTGETLRHKEVAYDEADLRHKFLTSLEYWKGRRPPEGVDIEEAWKCHRCDFVDICEWRQRKDQECVAKNMQKEKS